LRYSTSKNVVTLKSGQRSLKFLGTDTDRSATYYFLFMFGINYGPISYRFGNKRWFQSKILNFPCPHPMYFAPPLRGFLLELGIAAWCQKN